MEDKILFGYDLSGIRNMNEELVGELMEKVLSADNAVCKCQLCIEDIFALSLNKLKPLYVQSTFKETTFKDYDLTKILDRGEITEAIQEAIKKVSRHPHH
jgi:competence protein ComFB